MSVQHKDLGLSELHSKLAVNGVEIIRADTNGASDYILEFGGSANKKIAYNTTDNQMDFHVNTSAAVASLTSAGAMSFKNLQFTTVQAETCGETDTLTPTSSYIEITHDGGGYDLAVTLQTGLMPVGTLVCICYISTGGGRKCVLVSTGGNINLSGGKEAAMFVKSSVGWLPAPIGATTAP